MNAVRRPLAVALGSLLVLAAGGCGVGVRNTSSVTTLGEFAETPEGPCAVLRVVTRPEQKPRAMDTTWGLVQTPNADQRFAESAALAAGREGGLAMVEPLEVSRRLQDAGLEYSLQPGTDQLTRYVEVLGLESYLTAQVRRWRYSYFFFSSSAMVEYDLFCRRAEDHELIWSAGVLRQQRNVSDGEVAWAALRDTFRRLVEQSREPGE